jgi:hypothetical protein
MSNESVESQDNVIAEVTENLRKAGLSEDTVKASADAVEEEARTKGWRPDGPKSAKEFLDDEPFFKELKARGKEIKELKHTVESLKAHMDVERRAGYQEALDDLKRQRSDAIALSDEKSVNALDHQIREYESKVAEPAIQAPNILEHEAVKAFQEENKAWLADYVDLDHAEMNTFFQNRCKQLDATGINDPEEAIKLLRKDMAKKFPNYFNKDSSSGMVGTINDAVPTGHVQRKRQYSFKDLNDVQKEVCRNFVKRGAMTEEKYIDTLVKSGELR